MKTLKVLALVVVSVLSIGNSDTFAQVNAIFGWSSEDHRVAMVLPELKGRSNHEVVEAWKTSLKLLNADFPYQKFFEGPESVFSGYKSDDFLKLAPQSNQNEKNLKVCIVADRPQMISQSDAYSKSVYGSFMKPGVSLYVVPLGIETLLKVDSDLSDYHTQVSKFCSVLVSVGGADIDPKHYRQLNTLSVNTNFQRDDTELKLIKKYLEMDHGVFYGFCRGHQAHAVATGGELYQDLSLQGVSAEGHKPKFTPQGRESSWHEIELADEKNALFEAVGERKFRVNSRHHQAVKAAPGARVIAWADGKVVEAVEKRDLHGNVRVLTVQFHPEDMGTKEGTAVISWMVKNAERVSRLSKL